MMTLPANLRRKASGVLMFSKSTSHKTGVCPDVLRLNRVCLTTDILPDLGGPQITTFWPWESIPERVLQSPRLPAKDFPVTDLSNMNGESIKSLSYLSQI